MLTKISRAFKKALHLGPRQTMLVLKKRYDTKRADTRVRAAAYAHTAHHSWSMIAMKHETPSFETFWQQQANKPLQYIDHLYPEISSEQIVAQADLFVNKTFDLLGSGEVKFDTIPWHSDFRLHAQNPQADHLFEKNLFYKDIHVTAGTTSDLVKDIKIPWELSRFQHLLVVGKAYQLTGNDTYLNAFEQQITDWQKENPYLLGPNWVCPMDVGIRALNWLVAIHYFGNASLSLEFWQSIVCSLYDHMIYLENNWEIYDGRTSNHYLSDLIGYAYLCHFFQNLSGVADKRAWVFAEINREINRQVFAEGANYEGSTNYHRLVTEIFYHAWLLDQGALLPESFKHRLDRMFAFAAWSKDVVIGDHDSGKILYYGLDVRIHPSIHFASQNTQDERTNTFLYENNQQQFLKDSYTAHAECFPVRENVSKYEAKDDHLKHFPEFGISFLKSNHWSISLRHQAYQAQQPSGHFHNDVGSITVSYNNIPFIIDPGSYLYTPSAVWRNHFRSATVHNGFFLQGHEPVPFDERLFALDIPVTTWQPTDSFSTHHTLYKRFGVTAYRELLPTSQCLTITDWWQAEKETSLPTGWNFTLAPAVTVEQHEQGIVLKAQGMTLLLATDDLYFELEDGWASKAYGSKEPCKRLRAYKLIKPTERVRITIELFPLNSLA